MKSKEELSSTQLHKLRSTASIITYPFLFSFVPCRNHELNFTSEDIRGQFNQTFTSVAIVLESENNSYICTLHW